MKILFYNIQYCTGINKGGWRYPLSLWKYLFCGKNALKKLKRFIKNIDADILAVDEIDNGSIRTTFNSQVDNLAKDFYQSFFFSCKYSNFLKNLPIFCKQGNVVFSKQILKYNVHRVSGGLKDLVIEVEVNPKVSLFLVHLALGESARNKQLKQLFDIIKKIRIANKEVILTGDFNVDLTNINFSDFVKNSDLSSANFDHIKTFPSWNPKREIDYFFVSNKITINDFRVLGNIMSDHLPILLDYTLLNHNL